ncbi:two-component system response regulator YesN [Paenibacillus phyllosphaerae]|uniref:Two-component system response regulator YesN n=1 Tax=Paenibacillus phyllosphaerae TaxID=274593 RepID=A0A7W5B2C4_9BACL|nr:response regulator [Paenibacillus phyllosphaerae]MBB3112371.1 two-component system response regulator YesN [Paenibacillus phyllosphaerae]
MIHLMIVDDEERARYGVRTLIDWQEHGIRIVAEARDGVEALELLKEHQVDIVLTDIRMPEMDGLRLIEYLREHYPHIKSIIMSGYDDFNYAKKALTLGASDYLLKPSRRQEILGTVLKLTEEIYAANKQRMVMERLTAGFRESLPLLKDNALSRLVVAEDVPYGKLLGTLELSGLSFPEPYFGIGRIQIDQDAAKQSEYSTFENELLKYGLKNIAEETLSVAGTCAAFEDQDDIVVILNCDREQEVAHILPHMEQLRDNAKHYLKLSVSIAIGRVDKKIDQLRTTFLTATSALDTQFFMGPGKIINYEELLDVEPAESTYPIELEKMILHAVLTGEAATIRSNIELFRQTLLGEKHSKDLVMKFSFSLYFALYRLCIDKDLNVNDFFGHQLEEMTHKLAKSNVEHIHNELLQTALRIGEQLNDRKQGNKLLDNVLNYIRANYNQDINREIIANEVFITPGYVSSLFKQHLKMSFLDFLHQVRIEHACEFLKDPSRRIMDIAFEVGYSDEKYFFQVFKRYTGMTPKQFRNTTMR